MAEDESLATTLGERADLTLERCLETTTLQDIERTRIDTVRAIGRVTRLRTSARIQTPILADRQVSRDPEDERTDRAGQTPLGTPVPEPEERLLSHILGEVRRARPPLQVRNERRPVQPQRVVECVGVTATHSTKQLIAHGCGFPFGGEAGKLRQHGPRNTARPQ